MINLPHSRFQKRSKLKIVLLIIAMLSLVAAGFVYLNPFKIKDIRLVNTDATCFGEDNLKSFLNGKQFWWDLDTTYLSDQIKSHHPCVKSVQFSWKIPSRVVVSVEGRTAIAQVASFKYQSKLDLTITEATPSSQSALLDFSKLGIPPKPTYLIDGEGVIFGTTYENNLPTIYIANQNLNLGTQILNDTFSKVDQVIDQINQLIPIKLKLDPGSNLELKIIKDDIYIPTVPALVFSTQNDIQRQLVSLQLILDTATINQRPIKHVDLRFGKPIIVYDSPKVSK